MVTWQAGLMHLPGTMDPSRLLQLLEAGDPSLSQHMRRRATVLQHIRDSKSDLLDAPGLPYWATTLRLHGDLVLQIADTMLDTLDAALVAIYTRTGITVSEADALRHVAAATQVRWLEAEMATEGLVQA